MKTYNLDMHVSNNRGNLSVISHNSLPDTINRTYVISNVPKDANRGGHAHHNCVQYLHCIKGQCDMTLDNGHSKETIRLRSERGVVLADKMVWHDLYNFSDDCVLMVMATLPYEETDYIRDYDEFKSCVNSTPPTQPVVTPQSQKE